MYFSSEATVIVGNGAEQRMRKLVEQYDLKINLDITTVNTADDPGTADSLRHISAKIKVSPFDFCGIII